MLRSFSLLAATVLIAGCEGQPTSMSESDNDAPPAATAPADAPPADTTSDTDQVFKATTTLEAIGGSGVAGTLEWTQEGDTVTVTGKVTGLKPGMHGFHVHAKGDLSDKEAGESAGGHFNPTNAPHGKPGDDQRHVGDLGNIEADDQGVATVDIEDKMIRLAGENSIVGKALVIHEGEDKFTQPTGDAGGRVAFGLIELKKGQRPMPQP